MRSSLVFAAWLTVALVAWGQSPTPPSSPELLPPPGTAAETAPSSVANPPSSGADSTGAANNGAAAANNGAAAPSAISANPGAVNITTGTGRLGEILGIDKESGIRLGGLWAGDGNWLMSGGNNPGHWTGNSLTLIDLNLDSEKLWGWKGGMFGTEFLQFTGQPTNNDAGVVQGYNSLPGSAPLTRQELYQLWWRQSLLDDKLIVRVGKSIPTYDFGNVSRAVPTANPSAQIPSVTGLIYTPIFVNPTMLGKIPGYYNSATGITTTVAPTKNLYLSYGFYDGNIANGNEQIGLRGPQFNGYYFHIWELGYSWELGEQKKPGNIAGGIWDQTGKLTNTNLTIANGAQGVYAFGTQRLWFRNPGQDNSGVSGFWQAGANNTNTALARQFVGTGLTGFGLTPNRPKDSMGCGASWAFLNTDATAGTFFFQNVASPYTNMRTNELMTAGYYQAHITDAIYGLTNLTYIPNPGERPGIRDVWALTFRILVLF